MKHTIPWLIISLLILSSCHDPAQQLKKQEDTELQQVQIHLGDELANSSNRYKGNYQDVINGGSVTLHYSFLSSENTTIELQKDMFRFGSDWTVNLALATGVYTFWANAYDSSGEKIFETDTSRTYTITAATQSLNLGLQLNPILEDIAGTPTPIITQLTKPSGYFPRTPMEISYTVKGGAQDNLEVFVSVYDSTSNEIAGNSLASPNAPVELNSTQDNITIYQDSIVVSIPADANGPLKILFGVSSGLLQSGNYIEFTLDELFFSNELLLLKSFGELSLWLDASNVDGDYNSSLSDGYAVSVWKDLSGSGNDARQTVSGDQPTYLSSAQNGKGGVIFDREGTQSGEYLIIDDSETLRFNADEFSVFYVVKKTVDENPGDGGNPGILLSSGRAGASGSEYKNMLHYLYDDHFDINVDDDTTWKGGTTNGDFLGNYKIIYSERRNATTGSDTLNNYFDGLQESSFDIGVDYGTLTPNTPTPIHLGRKTYSLTSTTYSQYYLNGIVSEVIVFKKALADEERATVSAYLSSKWGLTSTVDSDGDGIVDASDPFPTDPSKWISFPEALRENIVNEFTPMQGLALWLDASNIDGNHNSGLNDGDSVSVWRDLSGHGIHLSQSIEADQPIYDSSDNSFKTVGVKDEFTQNLIASDLNSKLLNLTETDTELTIFMVRKDYDISQFTSNNPNILSYSNTTGTSFTAYRAVYGGTNDNKFIVHDPISWTNSYVHSVNSAMDERSINTYHRQTNSVEFYKNDPININKSDVGDNGIKPGLLDGINTLTLFDPSGGITVDLAEVLVFNKSLSDQDRSKITSYLASKWRLTTTVDSDGDGIVDASDPFPTDPSRWISFPEVLRDNVSDNFTAMQDLALWLDASNIDGQVNASLSEGDPVEQWKDLSGNISNLTQSTVYNQPTIISNSSKPYLSFDGSNDSLATDASNHILDNPTGDNITIFTVVKPKRGYYIFSTGGQSGSATGYALSYQGGNSFSIFKDNIAGQELTIADLFKTESTQLVTHSYSGAYTATEVRVNGETTGEVGNYMGSSSNSYQLMTVGRPNNADSFFGNFEIAEIIAITSDNPQKIIEIQTYLSNKWNLISTVDSDGDGIVDASDPFPTDPSRWISFPEALRDNVSDNFTAINGLALWLDARNIDGNHNSSLSDGDTVSVWKDLGQNSKHLTQEDTLRRPALIENVINGQPAIRFDGSADYLENSQGLSISNEASVFVVTNKSAYGGAYKKILSIRGSNGFHGLLLSEGPGGDNMYVYAATTSSYVNIITNESWKDSLVISSRVGSNSIDFDLNGKNIGTRDFNYPIQGADIFKLGWAYKSEYWDGDIAEVIVFNRRVSDQEKVMINHYLSNKWNLTSTVDSDGDGIPDEQDLAPTDPEQFGGNVWFEDFESYNDSNLNGQQDWNVVTRNTSGEIYLEADFGFDGTRALKFPHSGAGVGNRAYKLFADAESPFPTTHQGFFVYEADIIKLCWGAFLGPAYDSDSDNVIDDSEQGPGFWIVGGCGGNKLRVRLGDGSTIEADLSGNSWFRIRFVMDLSANQGQGSGTIFFKSLTDGETSWRNDATLTNFSLKLDTTADDSSNPTKWNALWLHFEGATAGLDNIRIEH